MKGLLKGKTVLATAMVGAGLAGSAEAATIVVNADITVSTTWTANNTYDLASQIYVTNGATLTIQPGTVIASTVTVNGGGSIAVTRGSKIIAIGTKDDPIIFTSLADVATWTPDGSHPTGADPKTGTWRSAASEWGNLTLLGEGYISENGIAGNVSTCDPDNVAKMEGLLEAFPGDPRVLYGGGDDDDDSGSLKYVSLRYGGRVIGVADELNGISLGGIGRETDISYIDIMNNVDDGIEVWGGTVGIHHFNIWNIGDDSLDLDQGWRGAMEFGLIVQGYSAVAAQGSGVGDNCLEIDGAEAADWQPVTTSTIYNLTVIGQPLDGDEGLALRDNARVQFRNCIFMDLGEDLVSEEAELGGYGFGGTLNFAQTWATNWNAAPPHANDCPPGTYWVQNSGKLAEITDSVFFRNLFGTAYNTATAVGVLPPNGTNDNVLIAGSDPADAPIQSITRSAVPVNVSGKNMLPVLGLDPRPANEALDSVSFAPESQGIWDGSVKYRGAFAPGANWLGDWTASYAFDFTDESAETQWFDLGSALAGVNGDPLLDGTGPLTAGSNNSVDLTKARANAPAVLFISIASSPLPFKGGTLVPVPILVQVSLPSTGGSGAFSLPFTWPNGIPAGFQIYFQWAIGDAAAVQGVSLSNALVAIAQ